MRYKRGQHGLGLASAALSRGRDENVRMDTSWAHYGSTKTPAGRGDATEQDQNDTMHFTASTDLIITVLMGAEGLAKAERRKKTKRKKKSF